jgi:hypothetical protein
MSSSLIVGLEFGVVVVVVLGLAVRELRSVSRPRKPPE